MFVKLLLLLLLFSLSFSYAYADAENQIETPTITLDLKEVPVRTALEMVFKNTGKNFSIDQSVEGIIPSLSFKNVSLEAAVNSITKNADLVYKIENDIYVISKRKTENFAAPPVFLSPVGDSASNYVEPVKTSEVIIEKIQLNHISPQELLMALGSMSRQYTPAMTYAAPLASTPYGSAFNRRNMLQNDYNQRYNPYTSNTYGIDRQNYSPYGYNNLYSPYGYNY